MPDPSAFNAHFGEMNTGGDDQVSWEEFTSHFPKATKDVHGTGSKWGWHGEPRRVAQIQGKPRFEARRIEGLKQKRTSFQFRHLSLTIHAERMT